MTIHTDITASDWKAALRYTLQSAKRSPWQQIILWVTAIGVGMMIAGGSFLPNLPVRPVYLVVAFFSGAAWLVVTARLGARRATTAVRRSVLGPRQVTIFDDGLYQRAAHGESLTHWPAIDGIEITGDHIFVMSESLPAAIIPRRAFASDSEREEFICEIQRRAGGPAPQPQ